MTCGHCVASVSSVLEQHKEIENFNVNLETGRVQLELNQEINLAQVQEELSKLGRYTIELTHHESN